MRAMPSATVSDVVTIKPRDSIARASRSRNALSSSTISSERSLSVCRAGMISDVTGARFTFVSRFR